MPSHATNVCVQCRHVTKIGAGCPAGHELRYMGRHWRAPKKDNDAAWKRIEAGDFLWDKRVTRKHLVDRWPGDWWNLVERGKRRRSGRIVPERRPV